MSLERLMLTGIQISERNLWACFRAVPSVVYLELIGLDSYVTEETLRVLDPACLWNNSCLLPNLDTLVVAGGIKNFPVLTGMLSRRWRHRLPELSVEGPPMARLRFAVIKTSAADAPDEYSMAELRQLVGEGLQLSLLSRDSEAWI